MMRFWVYDEDDVLVRKFYDKFSAEKFLQEGWRIEVQPLVKKQKPTPETHGEARW